MEEDYRLLEFATERQAELLKAYWKHGSDTKVSEIFNCARSTVYDARTAVLKKAIERGYSPEHDMVHDSPEGFYIKGVSTLYNGDGDVVSQWVKSSKEREELYRKIKLFVDELSTEIVPIKEIKISNTVDNDIMCVYPMADLHIGMYAWFEETNNDYDCDIAEELILNAMRRLIESAPPSKYALIAGLGDWFHSDTVENKTMKAGNILDVDTRWQRVFRIGVRIKKMCIEMALKKHEKVHVIIASGNHDQHTSYALALLMKAYFEKNKRVTIDDGVDNFRYYVFGKNLIGITHGLIKDAKLPGIMAADRAKDWGKTKHRVWYIGHKHQHMIKEFPGCTVEMFRTLSGKDAWTATSGFRSERDMQRIVMHKKYGEIERSRVSIQMIEGDAKNT